MSMLHYRNDNAPVEATKFIICQSLENCKVLEERLTFYQKDEHSRVHHKRVIPDSFSTTKIYSAKLRISDPKVKKNLISQHLYIVCKMLGKQASV